MRRFEILYQSWYGARCLKRRQSGLTVLKMEMWQELGAKECFGIFCFSCFETIQKAWPYNRMVPPAISKEVREDLGRKLPGRWTGRGGPISLATRSPELNPCGYYLWRHIKYILYRDPPQIINELKVNIREAVRAIREDTIKRVFKNIWNSSKLRNTWKRQTFRTYYELSNEFSKHFTSTCY